MWSTKNKKKWKLLLDFFFFYICVFQGSLYVWNISKLDLTDNIIISDNIIKGASLEKGYSDNLEFPSDGFSNDTVELDLVNKVSFRKFKIVFVGFRGTFKTKTGCKNFI